MKPDNHETNAFGPCFSAFRPASLSAFFFTLEIEISETSRIPSRAIRLEATHTTATQPKRIVDSRDTPSHAKSLLPPIRTRCSDTSICRSDAYDRRS